MIAVDDVQTSTMARPSSARYEAALSAIDGEIGPDAADDRLLLATKARALMLGYEARWAGAEWSPLALEHTVVLPIVNPETGRTSRTWRQAGKFDGVVQGYDKVALLEHKTTSDEIADPSAAYWRRLTIDCQVSKYMLQAWQAGLHLDGTLYDVIRKPSIRPKRLAVAERRSIVTTGRYCGSVVPDESVAWLRSNDTEDLALYGLRLAADALADPARYYQRRLIHRLDAEMVEYAGELWEIGLEIQRSRLRGLAYRNPQACMQWGSPCEYLGICSGHDEPDSDRWDRPASVHQELDGIDGDGRDVLTNSRIKCFQLCRRKHHYRYELGIRRRDEEEREALYFGHLLHKALEAWWGATEGGSSL